LQGGNEDTPHVVSDDDKDVDETEDEDNALEDEGEEVRCPLLHMLICILI
jgi:hypothetical protein